MHKLCIFQSLIVVSLSLNQEGESMALHPLIIDIEVVKEQGHNGW